MSRAISHLISTGLIGAGMIAWAFAGRVCLSNPDLDAPVNPLGIFGSPYGEVLAMAIQAPIDDHFHEAVEGGVDHDHNHESCEHCAHEPTHQQSGGSAANETNSESTAAGAALSQWIVSLQKAAATRTNPNPLTENHKRYLRRKIEDKLRFAYKLDPSHYANYNSLHFFLTEPQLGTRPELTPSAARLAEETIRYCLKQEHDPRPALTAAAATSNILELMFNDRHNSQPRFTTAQMRQNLGLLDFCIQRHMVIARRWDETNNWSLLSPQRVAECRERLQFIAKFREDAAAAIQRFEEDADSAGPTPPDP